MKNNKKYVLHISGLGENSKYSYPRIDRLSYSKFEKKNKEAIALGLVTEINQKYNKHLYKIFKKINKAQSQINIKAVFIKTDLLDKTIDLLFKGSLYSFKIHTASSYSDYKSGYVFSGDKQFPPLFCMGGFDGLKRASMSYSQFGASGIKLPEDTLYAEQTSVSHFDASKEGSQPERVWQIATNPDFNEGSIALDSRNNNSIGKNISIVELASHTSSFMHDAIEKIKDAKEDNMWFTYGVSRDTIDGEAIYKYRVRNHNKPAKSCDEALAFSNELIVSSVHQIVFVINTNEAEQIGVTILPSGSLGNSSPFIIVNNINDVEKLFPSPLIRQEIIIICKKNIWDKLNQKEEVDDVVSEYLDNTEYDIVIDNIKKSISKKYMSEKIAGKHNIRLPKDFKQRVFDLSFLIDIDNKLDTSPFIGIIQQELSLSRSDKEMIGDLDTLTFEQLIELFTMLASMKGMVKVLNKDTNEWILVQQKEKLSLCNEICNTINSGANSMLEESKFDDAIDKTRIEPEKPKLTCNGIHLADIESIKIEKYGVLLIRLDFEEGYFGKDSRKCRWDLYQDIDEAVDVLRKYHGTPKVYSRLKYTSNSSKLFSNVIPEVSKKSFGKIFKVLIDVDSLFYIARTWNMDAIECKKIEYLEQHNAKVTNKELHSAIEILDSDIESKYTIEPHIAIPQVEEIKTSYTMAAIKDGQYLFIDDSTCRIGEDMSAVFNSMLRAAGYKEETFCVLYKNLDKVRFNYYIDAANVKDKTISAVYVSSSYSDCNKNIALREHQKADIEDIKTEKENNIKLAEDEMVFIITPRENDIFDIVYKSKSELETNEEFVNYRTKFINPSSNLFVLIKNHLLYMAESDNYSLTKEQISSVNKIYVPSHAIGLHYIITPAAGIHSLDIIFSYSLQEYDSIDNLELQKGRNARKAFYDFKEEEKLN